MKFAAEIIAETAAAHQEDMDCDKLATEIVAALAAEGYQISAGQAPATGGSGHTVEVKPPRIKNKSRTQGDPA